MNVVLGGRGGGKSFKIAQEFIKLNESRKIMREKGALTCEWCNLPSDKVGIVQNTYDSKFVEADTPSGFDVQYGSLTLCPLCYFEHLYPDSCDDNGNPPQGVHRGLSLEHVRNFYKVEK